MGFHWKEQQTLVFGFFAHWQPQTAAGGNWAVTHLVDSTHFSAAEHILHQDLPGKIFICIL